MHVSWGKSKWENLAIVPLRRRDYRRSPKQQRQYEGRWIAIAHLAWEGMRPHVKLPNVMKSYGGDGDGVLERILVLGGGFNFSSRWARVCHPDMMP